MIGRQIEDVPLKLTIWTNPSTYHKSFESRRIKIFTLVIWMPLSRPIQKTTTSNFIYWTNNFGCQCECLGDDILKMVLSGE